MVFPLSFRELGRELLRRARRGACQAARNLLGRERPESHGGGPRTGDFPRSDSQLLVLKGYVWAS